MSQHEFFSKDSQVVIIDDQVSSLPEEMPTQLEAVQYKEGQLFYIDPKTITVSPAHTRKVMPSEKLEEMKASIQEQGFLQPIVLTRSGDDLQVVAGVRRYTAALELGLKEIPCIFRATTTALTSLAENLIRENLSIMELSEVLGELKSQMGLSHEEIAKKIGKSVPTVSELINLKRLPQSIKDECYKDNLVPQNILVEIGRLPDDQAMIEAFELFKAGVIMNRDQVRKKPPLKTNTPCSKFGRAAKTIINYLKTLEAADLEKEDAEILTNLKQRIEEKLGNLQAQAL